LVVFLILQNTPTQDSKIGVIIPALNEEKSIGVVLEDIKKELNEFNYKIIVVDGKSSDGTVSIAKQSGAQVIFQKNKGYGEALFAGYFFATEELNCEILVTVDADGTYSAKDCVKIIKKILSFDADYVVGRRRINSKNMTASHRFGNKVISWMIRRFLKINLHDTQSGLFAFRSYLIDNLDLRQTGWAVNTEALTKASDLGMIIDQVDISYSKRIGMTKGNTIRGGWTNLQVIIRMIRDSNPLLLMGAFGLALIVIGAGIGISVIYEIYFTGDLTRPNSVILSALLIIAGIQIFSFGLVADMMKKRQQPRLKKSHNLYEKN